MKIIVCVKQVPDSSSVEVDPKTGVLKRDGAGSKLNPYDLFALELAFALQEQHGGEIKVVTMGPPQAKSAILESIYMGADGGVLLSDRQFAGADVLATSYAISQGILKFGDFDLVICGKQTTDGDTAQVGPEIAEYLGADHATNVSSIDLVAEKSIVVSLSIDGAIQTQQMQLPCLLTVEKDANVPRLPSFKRKLAAQEEQVMTWTLSDMRDTNTDRYGLKGSPTQVERIFPPKKSTEKRIIEGESSKLAMELFTMLSDKKFI